MNAKFIMRILERTDFKTKLRLAKVIPKLGSGSDVEKCMLCPNMCLYACPVFDAEKRLTVSPSVKARIAYFGGEESIYRCLPCDACKVNCPQEISVNDTLREFRRGKYVERVERWLEKLERRVEEKEGRILYFPGCRTFEAGLFETTLDVLEKLGLDFAVRSDVLCCGMPFYELGDAVGFAEMIGKLKRVAAEYEGVVSSCPHCVHIMRENGVRAAHILSVLKPVKIGGEVSFHDPCILARKLGVIDEPRELLQKMGFEVIEVAFSREQTHCCGYGGIYRFVDESAARRVAERRRKQFEAEIVTACPACKLALGAKDVVELLSEAL